MKLPPRDIAEVVDELEKFRKRRDGPMPRLSVQVDGMVVDAAELLGVSEGRTLLLARDTSKIEYVDLGRVSRLVVHTSPETMHMLSFGRMKPRAGPPPTRLELRRRAAALGDEIGVPTTLAVDTFPEDEDAAVDDLVREVSSALRAIVVDAVGRDAVSRLSAITIELGPSATVTLAAGRLVIRASRIEEVVVGPESLRTSIEHVL